MVSPRAQARQGERAAEVVRPILKWAGGKRQLLPELRRFYPADFEGYVEPFLGSGAVFLDCYNQGLLDGRRVWLSDSNPDIIGCYRMVRFAVEQVIRELRSLEEGHRAGGTRHFYEVRDERFNARRRELLRQGDLSAGYTPRLAAMLIYLNRTGFNGLFRVNAKGDFNVPAGRYSSVRVCDDGNLRRLSTALNRPFVQLVLCDYRTALSAAATGDFVYLDPPYAPLSRTAHFTSYTAGGFGPDQQETLQRHIVALARTGVRVLLSNSASRQIHGLYADSEAAREAGLVVRRVSARRAINSRASARGAIGEYLITNVPATEPDELPPPDADGALGGRGKRRRSV